MPVAIRLQARNLKAWVTKGKRTAKSFSSPSTVRLLNRELGPRMREITEKAFKSQGSSTAGGRWQRLSPKYAARKRRLFGGKPILRATDSMFHSLTQPGGSHIAQGRHRPAGYVFRFGSNDPKLPFHVKGTRLMPRRSPLDPNEADLFSLSSLMGQVMTTAALKQGWFDRVLGFPFKNTGFNSVRVP